ncbi:MAG TPA: hypothetical protein VFN71_07130, partial [Methylomirabilota bacterium]|nr:hypothetical protein [Methylomirabilota bacterium]
MTAGYAGPFCALAIWTPGMMATGIAEGIDKGVTMKEVKAGTGALRDALTDAEVQQMLRDAVLRAALERAPATSVVAVLEGRPRGPEEPTSYAHLAAEGLDTVLEVGVLRLELRRANDPG